MIKTVNKTARVFLLEPVALDISQAKRFGQLAFIFPAESQRSSIWSPSFKREVVSNLMLQGFDPDADKIIVAGHMVPLAIALTAIRAAFGPFQALMYSTTDRDYIPRQLGD